MVIVLHPSLLRRRKGLLLGFVKDKYTSFEGSLPETDLVQFVPFGTAGKCLIVGVGSRGRDRWDGCMAFDWGNVQMPSFQIYPRSHETSVGQ